MSDGLSSTRVRKILSDAYENIPLAETVPETPDVSVDYDSLRDEHPLGVGGNADVSRAVFETDGRTVMLAIKKPRIRGTLHTESVERILNEAETWEKLDDHDHVVSVVDYGSDPLPWIAMEYMDGGHLGERIDGMSTLQRLWTAIAVTEGVRYAHKRGVAHLDIKPQNILFRSVPDAWDVPKLADWGLSSHLLEHTKSVEGMSPQYAAPEQFDEEYGTVDDRTDIYQLGAVFYELFTGSPPFTGRPTRVMRGVLEEEPRPPSAIADVPSGIDTVLLTALSKRKSNRYEDILYLRDALTDVLKHTCGGQEGTRSADEDTDDSGPHSTTRTRDRDSSADTVSDDERSRFGTRPAQERSDGIIVEVSAIFTNLDVTELVVYTEQDRITTTVLLWEVDNQSETTASWGNRAINCVLDDRVKQRPDVSPSGDILDTDRLTGGYEFAPGPGTTAELEPGVKARWINTIDLPPERTIDRVFVDGYDHEKLSIPIDESVVAANDTFPFN